MLQLRKFSFLFVVLLFLVSSCGDESGSSRSSPALYLQAVQPNPARRGETLQLEGIGWSPAPPENQIFIGTNLVPASKFELNGSGQNETIEIQIPFSSQMGTFLIFVKRGDQISNALPLTIIE